MSSLRQTLAHYNRSQEQLTQPTSADNLAQFDDRRDADLKALLSSIKPFAERLLTPRNLRLIRNWLAFSRTIVPSVVLNYEAETAQINHLLQKLKDEDTIKHIDYLGLKCFVTR